VGKRQRQSDLVEYSIKELKQMVKDKSLPTKRRMKVLTELKFQKERNRQKRSK
jgi:hypothetical protein